MENPKFTKEQQYWICDIIGDWYLLWKNKLTDGRQHNLGFAKEHLKQLLLGWKETDED